MIAKIAREIKLQLEVLNISEQEKEFLSNEAFVEKFILKSVRGIKNVGLFS